MSRLIVLSNRVKIPDSSPMAGGLAVALQDVLMGKSVVWMGWNSKIVDTLDDCSFACDSYKLSGSKHIALIDDDTQQADTTITYMTTALTTEQYQQFYCGFANNVLWPLMHEQTDLIQQAPEDYAGYQTVNALFARQLKKILRPDDVIWVHDYHFLSLAYHCRQLGITNRIGLFLHIPFVSLACWKQLDKSPELIEHLAHYDVLGTQTQRDKTNCLAVLQHYLQDRFLEHNYLRASLMNASCRAHHAFNAPKSLAAQLMLRLDDCLQHRLTINAYPIGINVARIQNQVLDLSLKSAKHAQRKDSIKPASQQIIAVDRIDYSKGLPERFSAYRAFLQQYPMYQNQLKLLQVACPSRLDLPVYKQLHDDVRQVVNDINQQFSVNEDTLDAFMANESESNTAKAHWEAITYSEKVLDHQTLMTAFWQSDVGWVNSLKDGMNLVAKEYVAAQNPDNPGVLVLSCYAGAAEQMQAAVIVDPHQPSSIMQGLKTALEMPLVERKRRYQILLKGLQQDNLHVWQQDFLDDLYDNKSYHTNSEYPDSIQMSDS